MEIFNPYAGVASELQLKGALHLHSTNSDGADPPREVFRDYGRIGFDFAVLTDHQALASAKDLEHGSALLAIPGCEYRGNASLPEMGLSGVRELPLGAVDLETSARVAKESGAFVVYNHPNWHFDHWPAYDMLRFRVGHALEVYNAVVEELPGVADSTNKWDILLSCGYRIWGVAGDDAHEAAHRGQAWVSVFADREESSILAAMKTGKFYASTGMRVEKIKLEGNCLTVTSPGARLIRFLAERGSVRQVAEGETASYKIREDDVYVRAEVYGDGLRRAWLNPVFVESDASEKLRSDFFSWFVRPHLGDCRT